MQFIDFYRGSGLLLNKNRKTSAYKITKSSDGNRYQFLCDLSGAVVCITKPYNNETPEAELMSAWETEGRQHFNRCQKCGRWVMDAMYNVEVFECVECSPFESEPNYCKNCGLKVDNSNKNCPSCGELLVYDGSLRL